MISARQLIEEVSTYLVDQDPDAPFEHWSETDLLSYFRLAVEIVASTQKDKFIKRTSLTLISGAVQTLPTNCHELTGVIGQMDEAGTLTNFPRRTVHAGMHLKGRLGCQDCRTATLGVVDYAVDSWSYDPDNPNVIFVEPPVPAGVSASLELTCFVPPVVDNIDSDVDLGQQLRPAVFELMLYYAYGVDTESVPSRDRSISHWNNAIALLGIDKQTANNRYAATRLPETRIGARK